jgi:hypothetical protein
VNVSWGIFYSVARKVVFGNGSILPVPDEVKVWKPRNDYHIKNSSKQKKSKAPYFLSNPNNLVTFKLKPFNPFVYCSSKLVLKRKVPALDHCLQIVLLHQYGCCNSNKTSLNQNSNSLKLPLNPKSALKPLASLSWDQLHLLLRVVLGLKTIQV